MNMYSRKEIANKLRGVAYTNEAATSGRETIPSDCDEYYNAGFRAAIAAMGLSFGLTPIQRVEDTALSLIDVTWVDADDFA